MQKSIKTHMVIIVSLLLIIGFFLVNASASNTPENVTPIGFALTIPTRTPTNTPERNYLPVILKLEGTPTTTLTICNAEFVESVIAGDDFVYIMGEIGSTPSPLTLTQTKTPVP